MRNATQCFVLMQTIHFSVNFFFLVLEEKRLCFKKKSLKNRILYIFYILKINMYKQLKFLFIKIFLMSQSFSIQGHVV